jgi:Na+/H+ antiporter NhaD/arsenite permease-like protein
VPCESAGRSWAAALPAQSAVVAEGVPVFTLAVVAVTLAGFVVSSAAGVNPAWAAVGGAAILAAGPRAAPYHGRQTGRIG